MGDYAVTEKVKKEYYRMTDLYRDSLLQVNASDSLGHVLVMADKCIVHAQYDEAIRMLMEYYNKPSLDDHSKAMLTYTLSEGYRLKGDKQGAKTLPGPFGYCRPKIGSKGICIFAQTRFPCLR